MPLQVSKEKAHAARRRKMWRMGLLLAAVALPVIVFANGGVFIQTKHGSPTQGVQRDTALPKGSCAQCHTSHAESPQDFGLWTANDNNLCFSCHSTGIRSYAGQTSYSLSGHSVSVASLNQAPVGQCDQCHNPHGAGDSRGLYPLMAARPEEQVCYSCHGSGFRPQGAADVQTPSTRRYSHSVSNYERLHDDAAEFNSVSVSPNPLLSGSSRHVECADCHNTHSARTTPRPDRSSNIGERLLGSWGVRPNYSGAPWTAPATYTVERFQATATELESYLCFKCHSNYAWGNSAPYTADGVLETNTAMEFSPGNPAYHNVTGQMEAAVPTEDLVFGTATPPGYINQWGPNSAMACSDCHASDPGSGSARGAHGSNFAFMLKKRFKAQAGGLDNTGRAGTQTDLCFDCHDWNTYGEGGSGTATNFSKDTNNLHTKSAHAQAGCFQCHSAVPHGFKRKHTIVYVTDGAPYYQSDPINYVLNKGGIQAYSHANGGAYTANNCKAGCHEGHQNSIPVNPLP
jgi:predicted CXXCH cytochrome family protein